MPFHFYPANFIHYFLRREANQFFTSIAIRSLALGMVLLFEPIYLYYYFGQSISLTILFLGTTHGLVALLAVFGGKFMAKYGLKKSMLLSHIFFWGYYISLFFIYGSFYLVPLALILKAVGMMLFWPAFHTDFLRFSEKGYQGREVGKMNIAILIPSIVSPVIGGWILSSFGYPTLFIIVLLILFTSAIPMFLSKEVHETYTDSYKGAWSRIFKKENWKVTLAYGFHSAELAVNGYIWPIFLAVLAISYTTIGALTTVAIGVAALFTLYMGRMSDTIINRVWFLNIGSVLTSIAWIIKYFVVTPFDALLAHTLYRVCRTSASVPFQTFSYKRAIAKGKEADEFIVYREIAINISKFFFMASLAVLFYFFPTINAAFLVAAVFSLGFMLMGVTPKLKW